MCYIVVFCVLHGVETANQRNDLTLQEIVLCVCYYSLCVHCTLCKLSTDGKYQRNYLILNQIFCDKTAPAAVDCDCADDDYTDDDDDDDTDDDNGLLNCNICRGCPSWSSPSLGVGEVQQQQQECGVNM